MRALRAHRPWPCASRRRKFAPAAHRLPRHSARDARDDDTASLDVAPVLCLTAKVRAGGLAARLCGAEERRPSGQRAQRAATSNLPHLSERSERSERSELCGRPEDRAPEGSRAASPTAAVGAPTDRPHAPSPLGDRRRPMNAASKPSVARQIALYAIAGIGLAIWAFPVVWGLLTSFKTERDVLAYPPVLIFTPTLANYRDVIFGASSIVPNIASSLIVATLATALTMLFAVPAAYAMARLRFPGKRGTGFYVLATQMLPPVGLIIPYYLVLQKIGGLDTYAGLVVIYLTFSLPFAIWLMVSYFEDVPLEMEEAALLDRAGRLRALWHVILPQVRGGIAVTTIFVFLNAWNEFMFAVVLGGNRVRPVTVAMFNFISVEQTQWARLAAGAMLAMAPVIVIGLVAQRHIVKGLTVGAVKGGGRRG
jgi:multiple sugar transport system permease protein